MTKWAGESAFQNIGKGVSMLLFENPYVAGLPPAALAAGDTVQMRMGMPKEQWIEAKVIDAAPDVVHVELADGSKWRMTPRQDADFPVGITWSAGPSQEWVFREQSA